MKTYSYKDKPIEVHGVPFFEKTEKLERLPEEVRKAVPSLEGLGRRCPGARICFRTNSTKITLTMTFETLHWDIGMSIYDCQSANVMIGNRQTARFAGLLHAEDYETMVCTEDFFKTNETEDVTIWLPRNEVIADFTISIEDDAEILPPTPYKYPPMLFYGSSITEGGCCCRVTNAYNALISQHLDIDYYNLGFSGGAKGELEIADFINTIPMSIFVYDYDHNAPSVEHLEKTHEAFFKRIREKNPTLPVVIMTKPDFDYDPLGAQRRRVIYNTYLNAKSSGDSNVYFIDGETFFGDTDRHACTCDCCHPNDLGFYRMFQTLAPVIRGILGE
ncbi:MAG: hypothetical protein IIX14_08760 [Clostridia bacterium]|nr:hypothetical protein [Clostridia bacterium]